MDQRAYRRPLKPTRKGAFGAPLHPIDLAGVPAPKPPDHAMEAISWRPTLRGLGAAILPKMDHSQGPIATPEPSSSDLEKCLSTDTEPCTIDRSIDPRSRELSCYPHDRFLETTSSRPTSSRTDRKTRSQPVRDSFGLLL